MKLGIALITLLIISVLATPVLAINEGKEIFVETPITIAPDPTMVKYEPVELLSSDLIESIKQVLGLAPKEQKVAVYRGIFVLGIIPPESKFNGMELTEECLHWQYGTDKWFECEQRSK